MNRSHRILGAAVFMTLLTTAACQDETPQPNALPVPGALTVSLKTPNGDDGAVVFSVRGKDIGTPVALNPAHRLFILSQDTEGGELRFAVIGERLSGPLVAFEVPDTRRADAYSVTIVEAADHGNVMRDALGGYAATVVRGEAQVPGERTADREPSTTLIP